MLFRSITASVSLNNVRRSECPIMTCDTLLSRNIDAEISPVKAPFSSSLQFCAPSFTKLGKSAFADSKSVKGVQMIISLLFVGANVEKSFSRLSDPFIFQLAAIILGLLREDKFNSFNIELYRFSTTTCL